MSASEFELKIQDIGITYIPKKLREQYGLNPRILPNDTVAVWYRAGANPSEIISSLEVLIQHFRLRVKQLPSIEKAVSP